MSHRLARVMPSVRVAVLAGACANGERAAARKTSRYLIVWADDAYRRAGDSDFLAVIDIDSTSATYAQVVAPPPIGAVHTMPHHIEPTMPPVGRLLFANAFMAGRTSVRCGRSARAAHRTHHRQHSGIPPPAQLCAPERWRLLATLQSGNGRSKGDPGGLALFSAEGELLRAVSAADPAFPDAAIRTYSLDVSPGGDRVVTTSTPMDSERTADVLQLWRLSDLSLLSTVAVPSTPGDSAHHYPLEIRFLDAEGRTALFYSWNCGFYLLSDLGSSPRIERVLALEHPRAHRLRRSRADWALLDHARGRGAQFMVLDVSDPAARVLRMCSRRILSALDIARSRE